VALLKAVLLLLLLLQLEEWEADASASQLSLLEAVREVLAALLKDLGRCATVVVKPRYSVARCPVSLAATQLCC
jgi:hypothetical protein